MTIGPEWRGKGRVLIGYERNFYFLKSMYEFTYLAPSPMNERPWLSNKNLTCNGKDKPLVGLPYC